LALRDEGMSVAEIVARLPLVDDNAVRRVLHAAGLPLSLKRAAAKADQILNLRHTGRPVREIAEKTGLHVRTIHRFLAEQHQRATEGDMAVWPNDILPLIWNLQACGVNRRAIAAELNQRQIPSRDGQPWTFRVVRKFMSAHQQSSDALRTHKVAAEAVAVLPLIRQLQMAGYDTGAIARRLQGKGTGRIWSKAAVEAVLARAGKALAELPAAVNARVAASNPPAVEEVSLPSPEVHYLAVPSARYDEAWLVEHVRPAIITLRAAGFKTAAPISRELNARGIIPLDGVPWTTPEVHRILKG
jgi:hypothetical protein